MTPCVVFMRADTPGEHPNQWRGVMYDCSPSNSDCAGAAPVHEARTGFYSEDVADYSRFTDLHCMSCLNGFTSKCRACRCKPTPEPTVFFRLSLSKVRLLVTPPQCRRHGGEYLVRSTSVLRIVFISQRGWLCGHIVGNGLLAPTDAAMFW